MRRGTKLNLRCRICGRAYKNPGPLNEHIARHRAADAAYRRQLQKETHRVQQPPAD